MPFTTRPRVRPSLWKRVAASAVFALQAAFALAPVWEQRHIVTMGLHAEQDGARDVGTHDEAGCVICAVRSMHAAPPAEARSRVENRATSLARNVDRSRPCAREGASIHLSRAPPSLLA